MKIAILGNGKMGKRIGELAKINGDKIVAVSSSNRPAISIDLSVADVAIDFSTPSSAFENISHAITVEFLLFQVLLHGLKKYKI